MMSTTVNQKLQPLAFIERVRESFKDSSFVYKNGSCFEFYLILRSVFPGAVAWTNLDHVWTEIDGRLYDIDGLRLEGKQGLLKMADDRALFRRAHNWKRGTRWRVDTAELVENNGRKNGVLNHILYPEKDHLEIEHNGKANWADLQDVKNKVWGKEALAVEIYPPQGFVVNGGSTEFHYRHLWKVPSWMPWPNIRKDDV